MQLTDLILSVLLLTGMAIFIYYIFKGKVDYEDCFEMNYSIEYLCERFKKIIKDIINMDIDILNLNKKDLENRKALKRSLSNAIRMCSQGDMNSKIIVLSRVKHTLLNIIKVDETSIDKIIPFNNINQLTAVDKFEIMLYLQKETVKKNVSRHM